MPNKIVRLPMVAAVVIVAIVVAACVIRLRDDEGPAQSDASVGRSSDQLAEKLERCRNATYEQKDELRECQKLWVEKRRQFLSTPPVRKDRSDAARSSSAPGNDESRVPPGRPTSDRE
jgi:conjugative transfer region protein TrbK